MEYVVRNDGCLVVQSLDSTASTRKDRHKERADAFNKVSLINKQKKKKKNKTTVSESNLNFDSIFLQFIESSEAREEGGVVQ